MKEQFEKWVMVASSGNADLSLNIHGEYDSPETSGFYELYKLARIDLSQALTDLAVQLANAESKCRELAVECKTLSRFISGSCYVFDGDHDDDMPDEFIDASHYMPIVTPATDSYLAEVRAQAHKEGAHFVANRMLAAWEAGFIDDTAKNAADIARMILTSTEFMADAPEGDFDRYFADGVLEDIAAQLRKGASLYANIRELKVSCLKRKTLPRNVVAVQWLNIKPRCR